jgi:hypothetical protein
MPGALLLLPGAILPLPDALTQSTKVSSHPGHKSHEAIRTLWALYCTVLYAMVIPAFFLAY